MAIAPNINYWLGRKYALLQQQADATTQNAATSAIAGQAAAAVDATRARLMPRETAAQIAQQRAQTELLGLQAQTVLPESAARVAQAQAETGLTLERSTGERQLNRVGAAPSESSLAAIRRMLGTTAPSLSQQETRPSLDPRPTVTPPEQREWWRF